jgi:putative redox protein
MTVRLFAKRKNIPLTGVSVSVGHTRGTLESRDRFDREIKLEGDLDEEQRMSLLGAANRCPVHATLHRGADIFTNLHEAIEDDAGRSHALHMSHMIESCSQGDAVSQ